MNSCAPLISRKKNSQNEAFLIFSAVWLQLRKDSDGILFYKAEFGGNFQSVDLRRNTRKPLEFPIIELPQLRISKTEKYRDLTILMQWIPEEYKEYFRDLSHAE